MFHNTSWPLLLLQGRKARYVSWNYTKPTIDLTGKNNMNEKANGGGTERLLLAMNGFYFYYDCSSSFSSQAFHSNINVEGPIHTSNNLSGLSSLSLQMYKSQRGKEKTKVNNNVKMDKLHSSLMLDIRYFAIWVLWGKVMNSSNRMVCVDVGVLNRKCADVIQVDKAKGSKEMNTSGRKELSRHTKFCWKHHSCPLQYITFLILLNIYYHITSFVCVWWGGGVGAKM